MSSAVCPTSSRLNVCGYFRRSLMCTPSAWGGIKARHTCSTYSWWLSWLDSGCVGEEFSKWFPKFLHLLTHLSSESRLLSPVWYRIEETLRCWSCFAVSQLRFCMSFCSLFLEDAPLRSVVASHIPRFFSVPEKVERKRENGDIAWRRSSLSRAWAAEMVT